MIAENKKYISFNVDVVVDKYLDKEGKEKQKKIQLRSIDSIRFMSSSLDALSSNLIGVSGMVCNLCKDSCEITHIDEYYVAHGKCKNCDSGYSKRQLNKNSILNDSDNLRVGNSDEQFRLLLRKGVDPYEYMSSWDKFKEIKLPPKEVFHGNLNMSVLVSMTTSTRKKFGRNLALKTWENTTIVT